jgi:6-pyruvoyltetrahydropterin/6-carboxytetrahydropterin synthase
MMIDLFGQATQALVPHELARLEWGLTPTYRVEMSMPDAAQTTPRVLIRQKFDFAAAHRLHSPALSEADNRSIFGKCNNPSGHGHNYQIEPTIAVPVDKAELFDLAAFEDLVEAAVIDPFDHKHLNLDTPDFDQSRGG